MVVRKRRLGERERPVDVRLDQPGLVHRRPRRRGRARRRDGPPHRAPSRHVRRPARADLRGRVGRSDVLAARPRGPPSMHRGARGHATLAA